MFELSIRDRIAIARAIHEGNRQFKKEMKGKNNAKNREAGSNENNDATKASENNTTTNSTASENVVHEAEVVNDTTSKKEKPKKKETIVDTTVVSEEPKKEEPVHEKPKKEEPVRTEQQIKAESEYPFERVNAEVDKNKNNSESISGNASASDSVEAAMKEPVIDFTKFGGTKVDFYESGSENLYEEKLNGKNNIFANAAQQQHAESQNANFNPAAQHINQNQNTNFNPAAQHINQNANFNPAAQPIQQPPVNFGSHKVDNPPVQKPKVVRNKPENVPHSNMDVDVVDYKEKVIQFGKVDKNIPEESKVELKSKFDMYNVPLFQEYSYLQDVQRVALKNNYQVAFVKKPETSLIICYVYDANGVVIAEKGFTIDHKGMYDGRIKVFPCICDFYENINAYPLFVNTNGKNVFDENLIRNLIVGGNDAIMSKPMYSNNYMVTNSIVSLITIPTKDIGKQDRKYIQNRLTEVTNDLASAITMYNPAAKFRIESFDKESKTIHLDTEGVSKNYGGPIFGGTVIHAVIGKNKIDITTK